MLLLERWIFFLLADYSSFLIMDPPIFLLMFLNNTALGGSLLKEVYKVSQSMLVRERNSFLNSKEAKIVKKQIINN